LKPDIVIDKGKVIFDTKWKILDESKGSFSIGEEDLYQMNTYGRRYQLENNDKIPPRLGLIYPKSSSSGDESLLFKFGGDMELEVYFFDLLAMNQNEEINKILRNFNLEDAKGELLSN
jgi:5-methylcytosine-specific restriction endonuclease McrBC regulatory subunit McrC